MGFVDLFFFLMVFVGNVVKLYLLLYEFNSHMTEGSDLNTILDLYVAQSSLIYSDKLGIVTQTIYSQAQKMYIY